MGVTGGSEELTGQKKARVQGTPGRVMGTLPLSPGGAASGEQWADRNGAAEVGPWLQTSLGTESQPVSSLAVSKPEPTPSLTGASPTGRNPVLQRARVRPCSWV